MKVFPISPRGYCHGVVSAIHEMRAIAKDESLPKPVTVLGMVVHNQKIVNDFEALGLKTLHDPKKTRLELLEEIDEGTVVFTAHGVSEAVYRRAEEKGLTVIDTTCKDVKTSQRTIKEHLEKGYSVLFIGKHTHPESETARGFGEDVHIVETEEDIKTITPKRDKLALTNQTTMSLYDIFTLSEKIKHRFPHVKVIEEICDATKARQKAVMEQPDVDHCFVVGDPRSNNSKKLVSVAKERGLSASLIESVEDLNVDHLKTLSSVSVTSGASTPTQITKEVVEFLKRFDPNDPNTQSTKSRIKDKNLFRR